MDYGCAIQEVMKPKEATAYFCTQVFTNFGLDESVLTLKKQNIFWIQNCYPLVV